MFAIVETLKVWVGGLRPDFLARCGWSIIEQKCTGDDKFVDAGRKSFPSGHVAYSFGSMTLLMRIFFHTFSPHLYSFFAALLCTLPLVWAGHISITRWWENRHQPMDLLGGAIIGIALALASYRLFCANRTYRHTRLCCS
ncbi:phosphatidic acid phosphatase type 2/haloperoxidase [Thamnocephalis sphaerospora]|uniref:Phosphatidic acid phosphatase type 2/haloperoxidase n=1 Tax=Thamnocephalis sphaerospora TaxID=78915 RepID=A0A4P9XNS3_9FUNG|nr:phosphatidic acid phosphatase type 2/haloperoxidase [Thamnocephalis sphaerospora]|eukprot:RKP07595.1 phosphatidic acid phosphatase type 2/haloperoxidase [Thamnocephalis sphaerospora]